MLTFKISSPSSFTVHDYDTHVIENLLLTLPKATYKSIDDSDNYIVTREHAMRIMRVTHIEDHKDLLEEFVEWNQTPKHEQRIQEGKGDDFCEISTESVSNSGTFYISIYRMSDTESCYLTLMHDTDQVMMDIQLP